MNISSFVKKYNGRHIDFDGSNPYECKDLVQFYVRDVLQVEKLPQGNAVDMWARYQQSIYQRIPNTPPAVPQEGDIMIWGKSVGRFGHIAVFLKGDTKTFVSFDQNYPIGSGCHEQPHGYTGVLGWLRRKGSWIDRIPLTFQEIWKRPGTNAEYAYFSRRVQKGSITNETELRASMDKWYTIVYPGGVYSKKGDFKWQIEKIR